MIIMERRNFSQILEEAQIDIRREYDRLYSTFFICKRHLTSMAITGL